MAGTGSASAATATWWTAFGSDELDTMMAAALAGNHDLEASLERIRQARAQARIAGAVLVPTVGASASISRNRTDLNGNSVQVGNRSEGLVTVSYEADLWGGNRAAANLAGETLNASIYARDALTLLIESEVASNYFLILSLNDRLDIARRNLEAAGELLKLVEAQYQRGATSELELAQQRSAVAIYRAEIPVLGQQRAAAVHALAILAGRLPESFAVEAPGLSSVNLPEVAAGQPATLLERRPDILEAEASLRSANFNVGVARAAFLPGLTLTADAGATGLVTAGGGMVGSLLAGLTAPIFEGGRLKGELDLADAQRRELVEAYRQTILTAIGEVEDALVAVRTNALQVQALNVAASEAERAYQLAVARYRAGSINFITLIDAQRTQLQTEDSLVQARFGQFAAATSLFKALGGGWQY